MLDRSSLFNLLVSGLCSDHQLVVSSLDIEICGVTTRDISCHDDAIGRISYVGRRHTPCSGLLAWGLTPDLLGLLRRLLGYLSSRRFLLDRLLDDILLSARLDGSLNGLSDDALLNWLPDDILLSARLDGLLDDTLLNSTLNGLLDDALPLDTSLDGLLLGDGPLGLRCYLVRVSSRPGFLILHF